MRKIHAPILLALSVALAAGSARAETEVDLDAGALTLATSNLFLDGGGEADVALRPGAELALRLGDVWSAGYAGQLNAYARHADLLSHRHELYLQASPAWGSDGEHEALVQLGVETLRNQDAYAALNLVRPSLLGQLALAPARRLHLETSAEASFRLFYDDRPSSSIDALAEARAVYTFPTRTTLAPRIAAGVRRYTGRQGGGEADLDGQLELGGRLGQGLWRRAGLQLEAANRWTAGDSGLLERKATEAQFQYLGEDFLYAGPRGHVALKQLVGSWTLGASLALERRRYGGWPALAADGTQTGDDRLDTRLTPRVYAGWRWVAAGDAAFAEEAGVTVALVHTRQWSNSAWYDTTIDASMVDVWMTW